ncbi:MAG TPA: hypothetical protein VF292_08180, partial [Rhodanobacteraceae bacterium]
EADIGEAGGPMRTAPAFVVIPAQAGIHFDLCDSNLDPGFRRDDEQNRGSSSRVQRRSVLACTGAIGLAIVGLPGAVRRPLPSSFRRKPESILTFATATWIPASAGMTSKIRVRRAASKGTRFWPAPGPSALQLLGFPAVRRRVVPLAN